MTPRLLTLKQLANAPPPAAGYLIDLDGTLMSGGELLDGAGELLERLPAPYAILSNDSEHLPEQLARTFRRRGVPLQAHNIVLAGVAALEEVLKRHPAQRLLLIGSRSLSHHARRLGAHLVKDDPDVILIARDRQFSYAKLASAARGVSNGARLYLACPDTSHPGPFGEPVPEVGALAAALFACAGEVPYEVIGKPEPLIFQTACSRMAAHPADCLMIGDNPLTDGEGAKRLGMRFCQVAPSGHL
ncbi:HAD superfamily hydrolase protein (plasmid) [Rhizobium etli bv. mimosae str. Mim1]|nr:HAD superfamily hydrolase protein [Rhizobium etli bv. mimosae str. Mim1]